MTANQIEVLNLGIAPIGVRETLIIESGLEWVQAHTTLKFDKESEEELASLPSCVKLFLVKFFDVQMLGTGISSESIEGLSLSFDTADKSKLIWQFAEELLSPYLACVRFVAASRKWK